ncbi:Rgg family transcriptional regulator [Oenococcus oeni]|uniref:Rgg family transcriptional regulator n=1 Tax=Oenococcus oeni TaxID=1247 RepID=UPI0010B2247D|nr:hypothetical protein OENI_80111 [Oenococcus oeni]SYW11884.1 hypothetical protein OENI_150015 [Oenococcus oeni]
MEKHHIAKVSQKEKQFLYNYLFAKETWAHYEIRLYMSIINLFSPMQFLLSNTANVEEWFGNN